MELFNELRKAFRGIQSELLADKIPAGLTTELGEELFNRIKGSTQWDEGDDLASVLRKWGVAVKRNPQIAELPAGFQEASFKVPLLRQKIETTKDQDEEIDKLLASQETADVYMPLASSWERAAGGEVNYLFENLLDKISGEENKIKELLAKSQEDIEQMIAEETDERLKQGLIKKSKALQNPKGRQGIERQAETFRVVEEEIKKIYSGFLESGDFERSYAKALEDLSELDGKIQLGKELRDLSAFHMYKSVMGEDWMETVDKYADGIRPTSDKVYGIHKLSREYIEEHYLHSEQRPEHIDHTPFSPALLKQLNVVWQQQADKEGRLPITILKDKLDHIIDPDPAKSRKTTEITMVPGAGLMNIYSGHLGDSCHSKHNGALAEGMYPDIRTWAYVTNRGKENEALKGTALSIRAEQDDGTPVLIVRANNPLENLIQSVDADEFTLSSLKEAVETAKRMREARIKEGKSLPSSKLRQIVAIPIDERGQASTNRQPVSDAYRKHFAGANRLGLKRTPDTEFNGHILWNKNNYNSWGTPVHSVAIWEMDETGKETWHNNWNQKR